MAAANFGLRSERRKTYATREGRVDWSGVVEDFDKMRMGRVILLNPKHFIDSPTKWWLADAARGALAKRKRTDADCKPAAVKFDTKGNVVIGHQHRQVIKVGRLLRLRRA